MKLKMLFISFLCCGQILLSAQTEDPFADVEVSLLSCRSGDELYSTFGHTAIRLYNPKTEVDIVYNYGTFDFNTPYFYIKFLRGKLPYRLAASNLSSFLSAYQYEERSVLEQKLKLTTKQKEKIFKKLANNIKPENKFYKYDFFFDNCTTRAMDVITTATGELRYGQEPKDITFRDMLKENLQSMPWSEFGIDLIIGAVADRKASRSEQYFLPLYLHAGVNNAQLFSGNSLAMTDDVLLDHEARDIDRKTPAANWPLYLAVLLLGLEILLFIRNPKLSSSYDKCWMWLMVILGLVMLFMWLGTDHLATKQNYNILWASPLFLIHSLSKNGAVRRAVAIVIVILCSIAVLNTLVQFLPQYFHPAFGCFAGISILKLVRNIKKPMPQSDKR